MSENEFWFGMLCPRCGEKTEWLPNVVQKKKNTVVEFGKFKCKTCCFESDWHETTIDSFDIQEVDD